MGKEVRLNIRITPQFKAELQEIAAFHGLSLSSYVHSVMVRQLRREHEANPDAFGRRSEFGEPAASFDLEGEIRDGKRPEVIMSNWLIHEGKQPQADYGLLMFGGWENMSENERADAMRDAKKILDRILPPAGRSSAEVKRFPVAADAPLRQEIQRQIDEVPLAKPKRRPKK